MTGRSSNGYGAIAWARCAGCVASSCVLLSALCGLWFSKNAFDAALASCPRESSTTRTCRFLRAAVLNSSCLQHHVSQSGQSEVSNRLARRKHPLNSSCSSRCQHQAPHPCCNIWVNPDPEPSWHGRLARRRYGLEHERAVSVLRLPGSYFTRGCCLHRSVVLACSGGS